MTVIEIIIDVIFFIGLFYCIELVYKGCKLCFKGKRMSK